MKILSRNKSTQPAVLSRLGGLWILSLVAIFAVSCANSGNKSAKSGDNSDSASDTKKDKKEVAINKKLPFERGSYVMETDPGNGHPIKYTVYFDNWGDWMATIGTTVDNSIQITKGKTCWSIDMDEMTGTQYNSSSNPSAGGMDAIAAMATAGKVMEGMEIKDLGVEEYLGYECKKIYAKYDAMKVEMTILTYQNLTMKSVMTGNINITTSITSIDFTPPPASVFEVPEGVEITEN